MHLDLNQKKIIILGSTGSIGKNALDIIVNFPEQFKVTGLSFHSNLKEGLAQIRNFKPVSAAVTGLEKTGFDVKSKLYFGFDGLKRMIENTDADIIVNGIAGASGFLPSLWTIESEKHLACANKETIVMGGDLIMGKAEKLNINIIPVDSEHSSLFFLMKNMEIKNIKEIILTASGGAFRDFPSDKLDTVTLEDALNHPTWSMGNKITIDSATMANKGLEIIEAKYLFKIDMDFIKVLIHPQSYVHSFIRTHDKNLYAQLSNPDMRIPIKNALTYPEITENNSEKLDLAGKTLNFYDWDKKKYPMLSLAYEAGKKGNAYPIIYNASNEVAVNAFMNNNISYVDINKYVNKTLEHNWEIKVNSIESILHTDREARRITSDFIRMN